MDRSCSDPRTTLVFYNKDSVRKHAFMEKASGSSQTCFQFSTLEKVDVAKNAVTFSLQDAFTVNLRGFILIRNEKKMF